MATAHTWQIFGATVPGANHLRNQLPNQDAIDWVATYGGAHPHIVLALADGHGNPRYFRSDRGARLAVQVIRQALSELATTYQHTSQMSLVKQFAEQRLPTELVRRWVEAVSADYAASPFSLAEIEPLRTVVQDQVYANPRLAYGSTLVATLVTQGFILYIQLGDGDMVVVDERGQATRPPLSIDRHLFANMTTSLCMQGAQRYIRTYFQPIAQRPPALLMLATDGYVNSFADERGFLRTAQDIFALLHQPAGGGVHLLRNQLADWLRATSDAGSGDDISVGVIYRAL
jgi:serine/threonine protein phosphatase PrpC